MSKLRKNRVHHRNIKDSQQVNQRFAPALEKLSSYLKTFPNAITSYEPSYTLKTKEGLELINSLDADRKRSQVTYTYIEKKEVEDSAIPMDIAQSEQTKPRTLGEEYIYKIPTEAAIHLLRAKKNWKVMQHDTVLYTN